MKFIQHSGSRAWQQVIKQKWWLNQQRAINRVENYLASNSDRQAMVRMPTGQARLLSSPRLRNFWPTSLAV